MEQIMELRKNRMASIRSNIKKLKVIHATTDRVHKILADRAIKQQNEDKQETNSIDFQLQKNTDKQQNQDLFQSKYTYGQKIGEGAHGIVKKCYQKQTNKLYAVKILRSDYQLYLRTKQNFIDIIDLNHPNIMKYKALYFGASKQTCILVMDYLPYPSLNEIQIQSQNELRKIIFQIILGLEYIHRKNICHRDIKPENILYDKQNKRCILIDFGVCCKMVERGCKKQMLTLTGTPYYRAPEMFIGGGYDQKVDLWALGVLIYKIITKVTPFESVYHSDTINNIMKGQVLFNDQIWGKYNYLVKDLVIHLLKPKQTRLSINQAKNHFWFESLRNPNEYCQSTKVNNGHLYFSLKRTESDIKYDVEWDLRRPTEAKNINGSQFSPQMFSLSKYQNQEKKKKWLNLQNSQEFDITQQKQEQQRSTMASSPTLRESRAKVKRHLTFSTHFHQDEFF